MSNRVASGFPFHMEVLPVAPEVQPEIPMQVLPDRAKR